MLRTSIFKYGRWRGFFFIGLLAWCISSNGFSKAQETKPHLLFPTRDLFSHANHKKILTELNIQCVDCHNFFIKSKKTGPLSTVVPKGFLRAPRHVCHQCHFGKVKLPRPNQCEICHTRTTFLKPKDHFVAWTKRHGRISQMDRDSCKQCHNARSCDRCHLQLDLMNPSVHNANFRLFHSVEARMNPQSCVTCHQSKSFCVNCHFGEQQ